MRTYIDRTPKQGFACWPGDTEFNYQELSWETVRVGSVTMSLHTGTHIDAPRHLIEKSTGVDAIPDDVLCGRVTLVDARGHTELDVDLFQSIETSRVLIRTDTWLDNTQFPMTFPLLTLDAAHLLANLGIVLLGIDVPSVDAIDSKNLPRHHILMDAGITLCEGLDFSTSNVCACVAELVIVPFAIKGADAAPVRAWLEDISYHFA
jgi:arylformamidase